MASQGLHPKEHNANVAPGAKCACAREARRANPVARRLPPKAQPERTRDGADVTRAAGRGQVLPYATAFRGQYDRCGVFAALNVGFTPYNLRYTISYCTTNC